MTGFSATRKPGGPSVDQLAEWRDNLAEVHAVLSGKFDARIAELNAAREQLEKAQTIATTVDQA